MQLVLAAPDESYGNPKLVLTVLSAAHSRWVVVAAHGSKSKGCGGDAAAARLMSAVAWCFVAPLDAATHPVVILWHRWTLPLTEARFVLSLR